MAHSIDPGPIAIVNLHSPCCYWVSCRKCVAGDDMAKALKSLKLWPHPNPKRGDRVVINRFGHWTRGILQKPLVVEGLEQIRFWEIYCLDRVQSVCVPAYDVLMPENQSDIFKLPEQVHLIALENCFRFMAEKLNRRKQDDYFIDQIALAEEVLRGNELILEEVTVASPSNLTFCRITMIVNEKRVPLLKVLEASPWLIVCSKNYMEVLQERGLLDEMKRLLEEMKLKNFPPPKKFTLKPPQRFYRPPSKTSYPIDSQTIGNLLKLLRGDLDVNVNSLRGSAWTETLDDYNNRLRLQNKAEDTSTSTSLSDGTFDDTPSEIIKTSTHSFEDLFNGEECLRMKKGELSQFEDAEEPSEFTKVSKNGVASTKYSLNIHDETDDDSWDRIDNFLSDDSAMEWDIFSDVLRVNEPRSSYNASISIRESPPSGCEDSKEQIRSLSCASSQPIDSDFSALSASDKCGPEKRAKTICDFGRGKLFRSHNEQTFTAGSLPPTKSISPVHATIQSSRLLATKCDDNLLQSPGKSEHMFGKCQSVGANIFQGDKGSAFIAGVGRGRGCLLKPLDTNNPSSDSHSVSSSRPPSSLGKGRGNLLKNLQDRLSSSSALSGHSRVNSTSSSSCSVSDTAKESSVVTISIDEEKSIRPQSDVELSNDRIAGPSVLDSSRKTSSQESLPVVSETLDDPIKMSMLSSQSKFDTDCPLSSTNSSASLSTVESPTPNTSDSKTGSDPSLKPEATLCSESGNICQGTQFQDVKNSTFNDGVARSSSTKSTTLKKSPPKEIFESVRNASCAGILHGNALIRQVKYLSELHLHPNIFAGPKSSRVDVLTRPQKLAMPAILDRRNVVIIAPNHCRKTTGFVIPILNLLLDEEHYSGLRRGLGPRCVLVAPTSDRVKKLGMLCNYYSRSRLRTIITYGGGLEIEQKNQLAEGCDILVTTPRCWLRLLKSSIVTNLIRVCHVVLDGFDELSSLFMDELKEISAKLEFLSKERKQNGASLPGVQIIVVGAQWSARIEGLVFKILHEPVLVITSFLEASLYARIKPVVSVIKIGGKQSKVAELIKKYAEMKTAVVCNNHEEVDKILQTLSFSRNIITAHDEMSPTVLSDVSRLWSSATKPPLLICSDGVVNELNIMDAQVLINYSLPLNKTSFSERFQLVRAYIPDRILDPEACVPDVTIHILFDESSEEPFPIIVDFLQRIPIKLPDKVLTVAKNIERGKELAKFDAHFCDNILQMGFCTNTSGCKGRHVIQKEIDLKDNGLNISQKFVKVLILRVHSAVKFSVRILSSTDDPRGTSSWEQCSSHLGVFTAKMALYFSTSMNLRLHNNAKVSDLVAYQSEPGEVVYRAQVRKILKKNDRGEPTFVKIFLIDECDELNVYAHLIYELPDHFKSFPPQACYMYLANLKPVDLDTTWNYAAFQAVDRAINGELDRDYENEEIIGKVLFCIGQNVIVENLRWFRQLEFSRVVSCNLRKLILDSNFGLPNPDYSEDLTLLCKDGGLLQDSSESDKTQAVETVNQLRIIPSQEKDVPPRWAHLSLPDAFETDLQQVYQSVTVSSVRSPSLLFVKLTTHNSSLQELENMIGAEIEKTVKPLKNPCVGGLCFAKLTFETGSVPSKGIYRRCKIQLLNMGNKTATVFFVDYGDEGEVPLKSLYKAPWTLMIRIPFQAIECSLAGIQPTSKTDWPIEAIEAFKAWTKSGENDKPEIFVKVMTFHQNAEWTDGKRYHIVMVHVNDNKCDLLNGRLIDRLWANWEKEPLKLEPELNSEVLIPTIPSLDEEIKEDLANDETLSFDFEECDETELKHFYMAMIDKLLPKSSTEMTEMITGKKAETKALTGPKKKSHSLRSIAHEPSHTLSASSKPILEDKACVPLAHPNPEISLSAVAGFLTPFVRWRQDYRTVSLSFLIPATKNYVVYPSPTRLVFCATVKSQDEEEKKYFSSIDFYGPVQTTHVKVDESHSSIRVTLQKVVCTRAFLWPRLMRKQTKDNRIRGYDDGESDEEQECPAPGPSIKGGYLPAGLEDDYSSDDDTSDGDDCNNGWDDFDFY